MVGRICASILLAILPVLQSAPPQNGDDQVQPPRLIRAEVPFYPPLAWTANITGEVVVRITVEQDSVKDAVIVSSDSPALSDATIATIQTWKFRPDERNQVSFVSRFEYTIEGEVTDTPETPRVQLELPRFVRVIARPFKPTCSGCRVE